MRWSTGRAIHCDVQEEASLQGIIKQRAVAARGVCVYVKTLTQSRLVGYWHQRLAQKYRQEVFRCGIGPQRLSERLRCTRCRQVMQALQQVVVDTKP